MTAEPPVEAVTVAPAMAAPPTSDVTVPEITPGRPVQAERPFCMALALF